MPKRTRIARTTVSLNDTGKTKKVQESPLPAATMIVGDPLPVSKLNLESKPSSTSTPELGLNNSKERFTFFWRIDSPFSQFHPCRFKTADVTYNCAEQYMMHQKAVLFGDKLMAKEILASTEPKKQKAFGRKVSNFDPKIWGARCKDIVADGNYLKFTQNELLLASLMATDGTTLVEASPRDKIWGIGMGASNPLAQNRATWKGRNYLGEVLTQVRERIKKETEQKSS